MGHIALDPGKSRNTRYPQQGHGLLTVFLGGSDTLYISRFRLKCESTSPGSWQSTPSVHSSVTSFQLPNPRLAGVPFIWREGDITIYPSKKTTKAKPADAQISEIVEWSGYEGPLYDTVWKDGGTWTISGKHWASLEHIAWVEKMRYGHDAPSERFTRSSPPYHRDSASLLIELRSQGARFAFETTFLHHGSRYRIVALPFP